MKIKYLYFILLWLPLLGFSQNAKLDSLKSQLSSTFDDTQKTALYNQISNELKYSDPNEMLNFGQKALQLAKEFNQKLEEAKAYLNIGTAYIIFGDYEKSLDHFVWAKSILEDLALDLYSIGLALQPFLPEKSKEIINIITKQKVVKPEIPLFKRLNN